MTVFANDNPLLVAPRPVRISSFNHYHIPRPPRILSTPVDHLERVKVTDSLEHQDLKVGFYGDNPADKDLSSPRSSPRSGLPSEALEEFLSILRPSFFPPTSPTSWSRRHPVTSLPVFHQHERAYSYGPRGRLSVAQAKNDVLVEELERSRSTQLSRNARSATPDPTLDLDAVADSDPFEAESPHFRWLTSSILSSPISRMHTRNPFLRYLTTPSPIPLTPLSPHSVPLPPPTPNEVELVA